MAERLATALPFSIYSMFYFPTLLLLLPPPHFRLWLNGVHPGQHLNPSLVSPIYFPPLFSFLPFSPLLYPSPSPHYRLWGAPWSLFLMRAPSLEWRPPKGGAGKFLGGFEAFWVPKPPKRCLGAPKGA